MGPEALLLMSSQVCKPLLSGECTPLLPPIFCPSFPTLSRALSIVSSSVQMYDFILQPFHAVFEEQQIF